MQDRGRFGYRDRGVPLSGAMDQQALRVGNLLVGNLDGAAGLEITIGVFKAEFLCEGDFAVTGAEVGARLNGRPIANWVCMNAKEGDILELGFATRGVRAYLLVSGGIAIDPVMGSRSTFLRGGFGGFEGRALKKGDIVPIGRRIGASIPVYPTGLVPKYSDQMLLRALPGPQEARISAEGVHAFFSGEYTVTERSDRMGSLLSGPVIPGGGDIISDGTYFGAVQVPGSCQPTILAADCQTTGGYVKIASLAACDLPLAGQLATGTRVHFEKITLDDARLAYLRNEYLLRRFHEKYGKPA